MKKIYLLRYRWEIIGVFDNVAEADRAIKEITDGNDALVKEDSRWKTVSKDDFIISVREMGLFSPLSHVIKYNGAYWVK